MTTITNEDLISIAKQKKQLAEKVYSSLTQEDLIFIFLSNRTYPTRENTLLQTSNTRTRSQEIVYKSLIDSE